jgi:hypothetical protein
MMSAIVGLVKVAKFEDEKRRRAALAAYQRHVTGVLEMFRDSLDKLDPSSRDEARRHIADEIKRLFHV